jgi:hypothetical protein
MCLLLGTNWGFISQKTAFFIVTAVKTSNLTQHIAGSVLRLMYDAKDRGLIPETTEFSLNVLPSGI